MIVSRLALAVLSTRSLFKRKCIALSLSRIYSESRRGNIMSKYPDSLAPSNLPSGMKKGQKSRARREPSGAFQLFQAPQIQQFKEAFSLIDQDGDGIVSEKDLKAVFANLGMQPKLVIMCLNFALNN